MEVSKLLSEEKLYQAFIKSGRKIKVKKSFYSGLLTFLADGYFAKLWKGLKNETRLNLKKYKLSDFEQLALVSYVGPLAHVFQHESYSNLLFPIRNICNALDSVLLKAPIFKDSVKLCRFCIREDLHDLQVNEKVFFRKYLNTTLNNWKKDTDVYIITAKLQQTKARCVYKLYNKNGENQVTFIRNAQFVVTKIELHGSHKWFYLDEI